MDTEQLTPYQQERRAASNWWHNLSRSDKLRFTNQYFHNWSMEMVENSTSAVHRVWKGEGNVVSK